MNRIQISYQDDRITIFDGTAEEIEAAIPQDVRSEPSPDEPLVRFIRGNHCRTRAELMNEVSAVFQFPYYFGHNWDALEECLNDLWWMKARAYLVVVTDFDELLKGDPEGQSTFVDILDRAADAWRHAKGWPMSDFVTDKNIDFRCVFQVEGGRKS